MDVIDVSLVPEKGHGHHVGMCRCDFEQWKVRIAHCGGGQISVGQVDSLLRPQPGTFRSGGNNPHMEFVEGLLSMMPVILPSSKITRSPPFTASKATGNVHPMRGNPGCPWRQGAAGSSSRVRTSTVPDVQQMRLREARQFPYTGDVTLARQGGARLHVCRVPNLHIATPWCLGRNPHLTARTARCRRNE